MAKGSVHYENRPHIRDRRTGVSLRRVTSGADDAHHLYFTNPSFTPDGGTLVYVSFGSGVPELYAQDIETGAAAQLTETRALAEFSPHVAHRSRAVFYIDPPEVHRVDIDTLADEVIGRVPEGRRPAILTVSRDDEQLAFAHCALPAEADRMEALAIWSLRPASAIQVLHADGSSERTVWEEGEWISHVQFCPTYPNLLLYCWEGPWDRVRQRMWLIETDGRHRRPLRPQEPGEMIGHEYWVSNGDEVVYEHRVREPGAAAGGRAAIRSIRSDGTGDRVIVECPVSHCMSDAGNSIIVASADAQQPPVLFRIDVAGGYYTVLCSHGSSWRGPRAHPHPSFSPDGRRLAFTSDREGSCDIYLVDLTEPAGV